MKREEMYESEDERKDKEKEMGETYLDRDKLGEEKRKKWRW